MFIRYKIFLLALSLVTSITAQEHPCKGHKVAFTFDDGPSAKTSPKVLSALKAEQVPATFFVLEQNVKLAKSNPVIQGFLKEIDQNPLFDLANHTATHEQLPRLGKTMGADAVKKEIQANKNNTLYDAITKRQGYEYFRAPYGATDSLVKEQLRKAQYSAHLMWHVDSLDWKPEQKKSPQALIAFTLDELKRACERFPKDEVLVLLFHDIHGNTAQALPSMIAQFKKIGLGFASLKDVEKQKHTNKAWKPTAEMAPENQRNESAHEK